MTANPRKALKATALLLVLSLVQLYVVRVSALPQGEVHGKLVTHHNQTVTVNGNTASGGQTILSGATIEVPNGVNATIDLGNLGSLDLAPGARVELTFSDGQIKVNILDGCVVLKVKKGTYGEIDSGQQKVASNDSVQKEAMTLDVCAPKGGTPVIHPVGGVVTTPAVLTGSPTVVIIGGAGLAALITLALVLPCSRASNPSPDTPGSASQCS